MSGCSDKDNSATYWTHWAKPDGALLVHGTFSQESIIMHVAHIFLVFISQIMLPVKERCDVTFLSDQTYNFHLVENVKI